MIFCIDLEFPVYKFVGALYFFKNFKKGLISHRQSSSVIISHHQSSSIIISREKVLRPKKNRKNDHTRQSSWNFPLIISSTEWTRTEHFHFFRKVPLSDFGGTEKFPTLPNRPNLRIVWRGEGGKPLRRAAGGMRGGVDVRTYVRMYVRMYVHAYVCTYVPSYVCTYVHIMICMYLRTYDRTYVRTYVCMYVRTYVRT